MLPRTWILLRDSTNILLESAPRGLVLAEIRKVIAETPGVAGVHDLHVWVTGADQTSASAHVVLVDGAEAEDVRLAVSARLRDDYKLEHITLQTERIPCEDSAIAHL